jgi:hypothetical protein
MSRILLLVLGIILMSSGIGKAVVLNTVADSDIRNDSAADMDYAKGDRSYLLSRYNWSNQIAKVYVKFALPADFGTATAATFNITCTQVTGNNWFVPYDIYGLNDSAAGNDWQDLAPGMYYGAPSGGLTWNNAPANLSGLSFDNTKSTYLGHFTEPGTAGNVGTFSGSALINWLNTDSDKAVTLMFVRRVESGFGQFSAEAKWASRDAGTPAQLNLSYNAVPEPATMAVLAIGGLAALRRRIA